MPLQVSDLFAGPVAVYYSNYATTLPADTLAVGGAWPAGWTRWGFTKDPLKVAYNFDQLDYMIQEALAAVHRIRSKEELLIECVLAELTPQAMHLAMDGQVTTTAPGAGQPGKDEFTVGGDVKLTVRQWGFEGDYIDEDAANFPIRAFVWRATAVTGGQLTFGKTETLGLPIKISALEDTTKAKLQRLWKFQKITEPAV